VGASCAFDSTEKNIMAKAVSPPTATGSAGAEFEAKIGATYLLAMLRGSEPRGMPGMAFDCVQFQRAHEGYPLDDIVVRAHDRRGVPAVLEIQVKRAITFAPQDETFKEVVSQIATAMQKPEFVAGQHEFAIATAQTTRAITGAYQEVLNWARKLGSAAIFMARIAREKSANEAMRTFVATLRNNLQATGVESSLGFGPLLERAAANAPSLFVALIVLNWVETAPRIEHIRLVLALAKSAVEAYSDDRTFWIDHGIGRRVCSWLGGLQRLHPNAFAPGADARPAIDRLLATLVAYGVVEARHLELTLQRQGS
jgi:hypothetical protein